MKERPIMFSSQMVKAILEGKKTQTRRMAKRFNPETGPAASVHPDGAGFGWVGWWPTPRTAHETAKCYPGKEGIPCPYGRVGDRLWVREKWAHFYPSYISVGSYQNTGNCFYLADESDPTTVPISGRWRNPMFMPRWASRITLEITGVRVERLQDITPSDAIDEGAITLPNRPTYEAECAEAKARGERKPPLGDGPVQRFRRLWEEINGKGSWESNPWLWVLSFKRVEQAELAKAVKP